MLLPERTPRQRIIDVITGTRLSSYQLAQMLGIPERQVEEHLPHIVKTIARDKTKKFILDPATCQDCSFLFKDRTRLTRQPLPPLSKRSHRRPPLRH
jgi:predicted Zn-ribbon and HTH transcriptional regulator